MPFRTVLECFLFENMEPQIGRFNRIEVLKLALLSRNIVPRTGLEPILKDHPQSAVKSPLQNERRGFLKD